MTDVKIDMNPQGDPAYRNLDIIADAIKTIKGADIFEACLKTNLHSFFGDEEFSIDIWDDCAYATNRKVAVAIPLCNVQIYINERNRDALVKALSELTFNEHSEQEDYLILSVVFSNEEES